MGVACIAHGKMGNLIVSYHFGDLDVDERIILKWIVKKYGVWL
jgi:hypothetical protein